MSKITTASRATLRKSNWVLTESTTICSVWIWCLMRRASCPPSPKRPLKNLKPLINNFCSFKKRVMNRTTAKPFLTFPTILAEVEEIEQRCCEKEGNKYQADENDCGVRYWPHVFYRRYVARVLMSTIHLLLHMPKWHERQGIRKECISTVYRSWMTAQQIETSTEPVNLQKKQSKKGYHNAKIILATCYHHGLTVE